MQIIKVQPPPHRLFKLKYTNENNIIKWKEKKDVLILKWKYFFPVKCSSFFLCIIYFSFIFLEQYADQLFNIEFVLRVHDRNLNNHVRKINNIYIFIFIFIFIYLYILGWHSGTNSISRCVYLRLWYYSKTNHWSSFNNCSRSITNESWS